MALNKGNSGKSEIKYDVKEKYTIAPRSGGYNLELRYMSWNGKDPRYDIRAWKVDEDGNEVCGKGIGLSGEELEALGGLISKLAET